MWRLDSVQKQQEKEELLIKVEFYSKFSTYLNSTLELSVLLFSKGQCRRQWDISKRREKAGVGNGATRTDAMKCPSSYLSFLTPDTASKHETAGKIQPSSNLQGNYNSCIKIISLNYCFCPKTIVPSLTAAEKDCKLHRGQTEKHH